MKILNMKVPDLKDQRRGGRVAEGARFEIVFTLTRNESSNLSLSANFESN